MLVYRVHGKSLYYLVNISGNLNCSKIIKPINFFKSGINKACTSFWGSLLFTSIHSACKIDWAM